MLSADGIILYACFLGMADILPDNGQADTENVFKVIGLTAVQMLPVSHILAFVMLPGGFIGRASALAVTQRLWTLPPRLRRPACDGSRLRKRNRPHRC